jgi:hypothetical protein
MSLFKKKIVTEVIRDVRIAFITIPLRKFIEVQSDFLYYGKLTAEESKDKDKLLKANDEIVDFIFSKIDIETTKEKITVEDLYELSGSEIAQILQTIVQSEMKEKVK